MWRPDLRDLVPPPTRWPELGLLEYLALAGAVILALLFAAEAWAQDRPRIECRELALLIGTVSWAREMGAKRDKVVHDIGQRHRHLGQVTANAIAREARRSWLEGLPADDAMQSTYDRCTARLGEIEREG